MREQDNWRPSKVRLGRGGRPVVPGRRRSLAPGSTAVALMMVRWHMKQLPRFARGTLVDLGCGEAPYYPLYAPYVDDILCTDWTNSLHGGQHLDFVCNFEHALPLAEACADTVLLSDVLEHVYRPKHVISEIFRILRPGGVAILHAPLLYVVHEAPYDYFRYTQFAMRRMAEDAGFAVEVLDPLGGKFLAWADLTGKLLQGSTPLGAAFTRGLQRLAVAVSPNPPRTKKFPIEIAAVLRKPA